MKRGEGGQGHALTTSQQDNPRHIPGHIPQPVFLLRCDSTGSRPPGRSRTEILVEARLLSLMSTAQQKSEHIWQADSPPSPLFWDQEKKRIWGRRISKGLPTGQCRNATSLWSQYRTAGRGPWCVRSTRQKRGRPDRASGTLPDQPFECPRVVGTCPGPERIGGRSRTKLAKPWWYCGGFEARIKMRRFETSARVHWQTGKICDEAEE
jgi:hypothetical protein